jgi:hypothetical protein
MDQKDKLVIITSVAILLILGIALTFVIQNDQTFRQRFDLDKPNMFEMMQQK